MTPSRELYNKIDTSLRVIRGLADVLINNDSFKTDATDEAPAQLDQSNEMVLHEAVLLLADAAQNELVELVNSLGLPS
ncbi:hypothetical protein [Pseudomonas petrae]|uniref:hypothetical protein n=1 Tax=Pseudomonas petrae TaxID=2912190 RepID=UPI001F42FAB7|nr:hypothetical protein [Pseudomonas petrae]MCF7558882.1 hypothetical protein [Pseudomonas petrae]